MPRTLILAFLLSTLGGGLVVLQASYEPGPHPAKLSARAQTPQSVTFQARVEHVEKEIRRQTKIARMLYLAHGCSDTYAELTARTAYKVGLPVRLIAGVVIIESTCRPRVISSEGAVGLMQVGRNWHISRRQLEDPTFNLMMGSTILVKYVRVYGLKEGLHAYNGFGNPSDDYAMKVLSTAGIKVTDAIQEQRKKG